MLFDNIAPQDEEKANEEIHQFVRDRIARNNQFSTGETTSCIVAWLEKAEQRITALEKK